MKRLFILILFSCSVAATHAADPFGGVSSWTASVDTSKPLRLEIAYGEATVTPGPTDSPEAVPVINAITPEFLRAAKTLRIALAPDDQGSVELSGQFTAIYRLKTKDQSHFLDLSFAVATEGRHAATTSVNLALDTWIVMAGSSRTESSTSKKGITTTTHKSHIIAVRLVIAKP